MYISAKVGERWKHEDQIARTELNLQVSWDFYELNCAKRIDA